VDLLRAGHPRPGVPPCRYGATDIPGFPMTAAFSPGALGPVILRNRIIKAATFEGRTPETLVTNALIDFHRQPARGGVGMTTLAYCAVSPEGRTHRQQIWLRQEAVPGLRRLTDAIHAEGAAVAAQIGHAGPVANAASNRLPAIGPTRSFSPLGFRTTRAATEPDLDRIVEAHADAARLVADSGVLVDLKTRVRDVFFPRL
jgi:2,4-dienoyl-CoA reductase-like NADH-dependent reductase (Old Yellow Enzyme family)